MIQVGIEPIRLIEELKKNEISEVVNKMPSYEGLEILVADKKTLQIIGATSADFINDNLKENGIDIEGKNLSKDYNFNCQINSYGAIDYNNITFGNVTTLAYYDNLGQIKFDGFDGRIRTVMHKHH